MDSLDKSNEFSMFQSMLDTGKESYERALSLYSKKNYLEAIGSLHVSIDNLYYKAKILLSKIYNDLIEASNDVFIQERYRLALLLYGITISEKGSYSNQAFNLLNKNYDTNKIETQGYSESVNLLGLLYYNGVGVKKDYDIAYNLFLESAMLNYPRGLVNLAYMQENGHTGYIEIEKAIQNLIKAIELEAYDACEKLCKIYNYVDVEYQNIIDEWIELLKENKGIVATNTLLEIAYIYINGKSVPQNNKKARDILEALKKDGNIVAKAHLAFMEFDEIRPNYESIEKELKDVLGNKTKEELGSESGILLNNLAYALQKQAETILDDPQKKQKVYEESFKYYTWASEKGINIAHLGLAQLYYEGLGVEKNILNAKCEIEKCDENTLAGRPVIAKLIHLPMIQLADKSIIEKVIEIGYQSHLLFEDSFDFLARYARENIEKAPQFLSHYTSFDTIRNILKIPDNADTNCGSLRMSNLQQVNDPSEGRSLINYISKKDIEISDFFDAINFKDITKRNGMEKMVYSVSFCEKNDNLNLWRLYGDNAKGVSIDIPKNIFAIPQNSFSMGKLFSEHSIMGSANVSAPIASIKENSKIKNIRTLLLFKVIYSDELKHKYFDIISSKLRRIIALHKDVCEASYSNEQEKEIFINHILELIKLAFIPYIFFFKNEEYKYENEWRLLSIHSHKDGVKLIDRNKESNSLYIDLPAFSFKDGKYRIVLGPNIKNKSAAETEIEYRISVNRIPNKQIKVVSSDIPYSG